VRECVTEKMKCVGQFVSHKCTYTLCAHVYLCVCVSVRRTVCLTQVYLHFVCACVFVCVYMCVGQFVSHKCTYTLCAHVYLCVCVCVGQFVTYILCAHVYLCVCVCACVCVCVCVSYTTSTPRPPIFIQVFYSVFTAIPFHIPSA
jgi:hypothetical protein